jgi:TRAP-type C4-dicarboxylate transport system substrate-binding protein
MQKFIPSSLTILLMIILISFGCATSTPTPASKPVPTPTPAPATEGVIALKFTYHHPPQSFIAKQILIPWTQSIEKASNGRVKITHYGGETLVKMVDQYDSLVSGLSDISTISPTVTPGRFPLAEIDQLPMLFPNAELAARVHNELLEKYCVNTELSKVKLLFDESLPPNQFFTTRPVQKLEDLKGFKMRVEGKVDTWAIEALGATPLQMGTGELYSALERGLIEGVAFAYQGVLSYGFQQITKYRTVCDISTRSFPVIMNQQVWNKLPTDIQKIFTENSGPLASGRFGAIYDADCNTSMQAIIAYDKKVGNPEFFTLSGDEKARWQQTVSTVWSKWLEEVKGKGLEGKAMLDDALSLVKKYSK